METVTCRCGRPFERWVTLQGRKVWYWCKECDAHGSGCISREHILFVPGQQYWQPCTY